MKPTNYDEDGDEVGTNTRKEQPHKIFNVIAEITHDLFYKVLRVHLPHIGASLLHLNR